MRKFWLITIGILVGLGLVFGAWRLAKRNYRYQGSLIDPPIPAVDFSLTDQNGRSFRLSDQKGKIVMVFFGFTHCASECPVTLSQFKQIKQQLGNKAQDVEFVMITVDPERDSVAGIRQYLSAFDPSFIGLTGAQADMEQVWKSYGIFVEKTASASHSSGDHGEYDVEHTLRTYLVDQQGNWRLTYPFGIEVNQITSDLENLLN